MLKKNTQYLIIDDNILINPNNLEFYQNSLSISDEHVLILSKFYQNIIINKTTRVLYLYISEFSSVYSDINLTGIILDNNNYDYNSNINTFNYSENFHSIKSSNDRENLEYTKPFINAIINKRINKLKCIK